MRPLAMPKSNAKTTSSPCVLASASSGPRRLGYGPIKDMLIGLSVCGADGVVIAGGMARHGRARQRRRRQRRHFQRG
mgnify:CR=1 FL=1